MNVARRSWGIVAIGLLLAIVSTATARYSGGSGTAQDPYQIATAADLIALGETPADYDKHFVLTADIDLDPKLPGRKTFDKAVIAPSAWPNTVPFTGVLDGKSHTISHLTTTSRGLFGQLGGALKNLGMVDVSVIGSGARAALVGDNWGTVTQCYSTGTVKGTGSRVGGLVGTNDGTLTQCYSAGLVSGKSSVGGLVGYHFRGTLAQCYSTAAVGGDYYVGGLVGENNLGSVTQCYSTGLVTGKSDVGGLVGSGSTTSATACFWDIQTSGQSASAGGVGLTTAEMMDRDVLGLNGFANDPNWVLDVGRDYPRLAWEGAPGQIIPQPRIPWLQGGGTTAEPYRLDTADQLIRLGKAPTLWDKHFVLGADIDLNPALPGRQTFRQAVIQTFTGVFDGKGHVLRHLTISGRDYVGLFGELASRAEVKSLAVVDVSVTGSGDAVGGLVGESDYGGRVTWCFSTGTVKGTASYVGGLVGFNMGSVTQCYGTAAVSGSTDVGGLVGYNGSAAVIECYSTGPVSATGWDVGGLVGRADGRNVVGCFWDTQTTGQTKSAGGIGKTTAQMYDIRTYVGAGWDFVDDLKDGTCQVWQMPKGGGCPVLAIFNGYTRPQLHGGGTLEDPYLIHDALELGAMAYYSDRARYRLVAPVDLSGIHWGMAPIPWFAGTFDGNGHTISHLTIRGGTFLGLFGQLVFGAEVKSLGVVDVNVVGSGNCVGGLVGSNGSYQTPGGNVIRCFGSGAVNGGGSVGGLVGYNADRSSVADCYSTTAVTGEGSVGGLVGGTAAL